MQKFQVKMKKLCETLAASTPTTGSPTTLSTGSPTPDIKKQKQRQRTRRKKDARTRKRRNHALRFDGPFTKITARTGNALARLFSKSTFYVSMNVETWSRIGGDVMLIGSSTGSWCSGLYFYLRSHTGGTIGVGHQVHPSCLCRADCRLAVQ